MAALNEGNLAARLLALRNAIADACTQAGRDAQAVRLVAVSKRHEAAAVRTVLQLGQRDFGENYAQELRDKSAALAAEADALGVAPRWHFIGPLQRNKVPLVVGRAALIHSVDSLPLASAISARVQHLRKALPGLVQNCLIQVNIAQEPQKSGCDPDALPTLLDAIAAAGGTLFCLGLMCLPPQQDDPEASRCHFRRLRELLHSAARQKRPHVELRELSMGMSHDFQVAIREGATILRVGTALFGARL